MNEEQIENLIRSAYESGSINQLKVSDIRKWLKSYIAAYTEDMAAFPAQKEMAHWDLIMTDYDKTKKALFVCALFREENILFAAGTGSCSEVREFVDRGFPDDPSTVLNAIDERFELSDARLEVSMHELVSWLA